MLTSYSHEYITPIQLKLPLGIEVKIDDGDDQLRMPMLIQEAVIEAGLCKHVRNPHRISHGYDPLQMLCTVLLGFSLFGYASLRKLEEACKSDIRFIYLMDGAKPSFMSFGRFIKDDLTGEVEEILHDMMRWISKKEGVDLRTIVTMDGTKFEANANKMTFVWMKATEKFEIKTWKKAIQAIESLNAWYASNGIATRESTLKKPDLGFLMHACITIETIAKEKDIVFVSGKGKRKNSIQRIYDTLKECALKMWKYEIHKDMAGDRNSFSKTDADATFMHMKYDYYNHTNVFKPGYNVQAGTADGFISHLYVSEDPNDMQTFIPFLEGYKKAYGSFPLMPVADAGYGSYDNYSFCKENGMELVQKYPGFDKEKHIKEKDKFKVYSFKRNDRNELVCPQGHAFHTVSSRIEKRGIYEKLIETQETGCCEGCPLAKQCTKSRSGIRRIHRCRVMENYKEEVRKNLDCAPGRELRILRDVQSEGTFGDIKTNHGYERLRRRMKSNVKAEIYLVAIGHDLRKLASLRSRMNKDIRS